MDENCDLTINTGNVFELTIWLRLREYNICLIYTVHLYFVVGYRVTNEDWGQWKYHHTVSYELQSLMQRLLSKI